MTHATEPPNPLRDSELDRLQAEHSTRWKVWRTPRYWMATALVDGVEPTLMEESPDALEARMRNPGPWGNQRLSKNEL